MDWRPQTLASQRCRPIADASAALTREQLDAALADYPAWRLDTDGDPSIVREWTFDDFGTSFLFATKVAQIVDAEDHHPELTVEWGRCRVRFATHSAGGVTVNDLICAAKLDRL